MNDEPKDLDPTTDPIDDSSGNHEVPFVTSVKEEHEDALQFDPSIASPSVLGEENPFGGDATDSESPDIDSALAAVGRSNDDDGVKPLGE